MGEPNQPVWRTEVLSRTVRTTLSALGPFADNEQFYLAGGTALALWLGHRRSVDLDWFRPTSIADPLMLAQRITAFGIPWSTLRTSSGTLERTVRTVRVTFLEYPYPILQPPSPLLCCSCRVASLADIAAMKLSAVVGRGSRKDFCDIYALLKSGMTLHQMMDCYRKRYNVTDIGHVLRGLFYFEDADAGVTVRMLSVKRGTRSRPRWLTQPWRMR